MPDEHRRRVLCQHRRRKSDDRRYGFGLLGHLSEMCQGAGVQARVDYDAIPKLPGVEEYIKLGAVPGGTERNFASYGHLMGEMPREVRDLLCDPQTLAVCCWRSCRKQKMRSKLQPPSLALN